MNIRHNLLNIFGLITILTSIVYFLYLSQKTIKKRKKSQENEIQKEDSEVFQILKNELVDQEDKTSINSGFKSKSSVNLAFKESTGMTLSNYMKSIQSQKV